MCCCLKKRQRIFEFFQYLELGRVRNLTSPSLLFYNRLREPGCTGYLWTSAVASRERDRISRASQEIFMITGENSHGESRGAKRASVLTSVAKILLKQMDWLPQWLQFGMSWLIHRVASL